MTTDRLRVFVPYGRAAASSRVRVLAWLDRTATPYSLDQYAGTTNHQPAVLLRSPIRVALAEYRVRRAVSRKGGRVLVHREVSPFSGGRLEKALGLHADLLVYDFDDALMDMPRRGVHRVWSKAVSCDAAISAADRVLAGSQYLADYASALNTDVRYLPTCVDPDAYSAKADFMIGPQPRLVWLGSPATERFLHMIEEPLLESHRLHGARLTVISAGKRRFGALDVMIDRVAWFEGIEATLGRYDLGIAPLSSGPFEQGKCAYKLLQYAAAGLPSIASPVGANGVVAEQLGLGSATTFRQWVDGLGDLIRSSREDRARVGLRARQLVAERYSYAAWEQCWLDAISVREG